MATSDKIMARAILALVIASEVPPYPLTSAPINKSDVVPHKIGSVIVSAVCARFDST